MSDKTGATADVMSLFSVSPGGSIGAPAVTDACTSKCVDFIAVAAKQHDAFRDMKHMQKRLRKDELRVLRGEEEVDEAQLDNDVADLDTSASEDDVEAVCQAPADFVSEKRSMHTTNKGAKATLCVPVCCQLACTDHYSPNATGIRVVVMDRASSVIFLCRWYGHWHLDRVAV